MIRKPTFDASLLLAILASILIACAPHDGSSEDPDSSDGPPQPTLDITAFNLTENPANDLSLFATWQTSEPATTILTVRCGDDFDQSYESTTLSTSHEVFVMGLVENSTCDLSAFARAADGAEGTFEASYITSPLPDYLPRPTLNEQLFLPPLIPMIQPGWTLIGLSNGFDDVPLGGALIDEHGRYRWYHQLATDRSGWDNQLRIVEDGVMFGGCCGVNTTIITWDGRVDWEAPFESHHEAFLIDDERYLVHLDKPSPCPEPIQDASSVRIWDRLAEELVWTWHLCDHYTPSRNFNDWDHTNGIDMFPEGDAVVVSVRHQNALFRVNLETNELEWVLGYGGLEQDGFNGDFAMDEADRFIEQHAPEVLPNGNILVFDNGSCGGCRNAGVDVNLRGWSRAIEIAYDTTTWEAEVVWEFRPDPDLFARMWGDADRLGNGNTLVTFGQRRERWPNHVIEVTPNSEVVWWLTMPLKWGLYRAERVDAYYGHVVDLSAR